MTHQWNVKVSGTHEKLGLRKLTLVVFELTRDEAKHAAMGDAKAYGLFNVTIDHIAQHGIAHSCTFAESVRGKQRRDERRHKRQQREQGANGMGEGTKGGGHRGARAAEVGQHSGLRRKAET